MENIEEVYDIDWDEIESIEYIEPENNEYVYDFSVDDVETFTTADNLIVHNTLNSIDYNEKIVIRKNKSKIIVTKIGSFIDMIQKSYDKKYQEYYETGDQTLIRVNEQNENYDIWAVDWDGKYKWKELQAVTKHLPLVDGKRDNLVKITLESKRTAIGTKAKSFLRYNKETNKIEPVGGEKIQIGDYVPITKNFVIPKEEQLHHLDLEQYFPKTEYIYGSDFIKAKEIRDSIFDKNHWGYKKYNGTVFTLPYKNSGSFLKSLKNNRINNIKKNYIYNKYKLTCIPTRIELDELFGFFIGAYLSDGCTDRGTIVISNNDKDFRDRIYDFCDLLRINYKIRKIKCDEHKRNEWIFKDRYENEIKYHKEEKKYKSNKCGTGFDIYIYSELLHKLIINICSKTSFDKKVPEFSYLANEEFIKGLIDGYISGDGSIHNIISYSTNSIDLLNGIALLLKRFGIHTKFYKYKKNYNGTINKIDVNIFQDIFKLTIKHKNEKLLKYKKIKRTKQKYFGNNILEKVIEKEEIPSSHKYVYDLTVKDNPNFLLFNGIPQKNTFHMAGVSSKSNINHGVPRIKELIRVTKTPKTPSLTIYLKDEYKNKRENANNVLSKIIQTDISYFVKNISMYYDPDILNSVIEEDKEFMKDYYSFYLQDEIDTISPWVLRIEIDELLLLNKNITMFDIYYFFMNKYSKHKLHIIYSDENSSNLVFHFRLLHNDINEIITDEDYTKYQKYSNTLLKINNTMTYKIILNNNTNINITKLKNIFKKYNIKQDDDKYVISNILIDDYDIIFEEIEHNKFKLYINKDKYTKDIFIEKYNLKNPKIEKDLVFIEEQEKYNIFNITFIDKIKEDIYITNNDQEKLLKIENDIIKNTTFSGIDNIEQVLLREINRNTTTKTGDVVTKKEIVIDTTGTNLNDIMKLYDIVNTNLTITNDLYETYEMFGIEGVRTLLKQEILAVMDHSGIYINQKHIILLADYMTHRGVLISINRHGMNKLNTEPLTKASFEEPCHHLADASVYNISDNMNTVASNLIMGQVGNFGTGMVDVEFDIEKLKTCYYDNKIQNENKRCVVKLD